MISSIQKYLTDFIRRDGSYVVLASLLSRLLSFGGSWIALMLLPSYELGLVIYAFSIVSFLIPIGGFGAQQSLLRYGSILQRYDEKIDLYNLTLIKGIEGSVLLMLVILILSPFITYKLPESTLYFILLIVSILSYFVFENLKIKYRILHNNKKFALMEIGFSAIQIISILIFSYTFGVYGYIATLSLSPLFTFFLFNRLTFTKPIQSFNFVDSKFWSYGFFAGLANVATQLLFALDIILIGFLLSDPQLVTYYKYVSIIPISLLILPNIIITTDFVLITNNINNQPFINSYIKKFLLLFSTISIIILVISVLFGNSIFRMFGEDYTKYYDLFLILTIGIIGVFTIRSLFGNLLSSIGKAKINYWIAFCSLLLNVGLSYYFIPKYGIIGAGITSAIVMWTSGILSMLLFYLFYKKINITS